MTPEERAKMFRSTELFCLLPVMNTEQFEQVDHAGIVTALAKHIRAAVEEERKRCHGLVDAWAKFEWKEGGVTYCIGCGEAEEVAKAILNPAHALVIERERQKYLEGKPLLKVEVNEKDIRERGKE